MQQCENKAARRPGQENSPVTFAAPSIAGGVRLSYVEAEFTSFPSQDQVEPYSSLRRGKLYSLAREGHIKTVSLREPGKTRGRRLIVLSTLKAYLRRLNAEQNPEGAVGNKGGSDETE
jgi:hypothetical protein